MSRRHAWTSWYWDEWSTDTATLSDSEYAIYHRFLAHYYKSQRPLEANATSLPRLCLAFDDGQKLAMTAVLGKFFELRGGFYHNKRADLELEKMLSISKERQEAGKRGGIAKARSVAIATVLPEQTAKQNPTQPQPQPHIKPNPPDPPSLKGLTVRDRRRLNEEVSRLMDKDVSTTLEEAMQVACAELLLPLEDAKAAAKQAGLGDGLKKRKFA